MSYLTQLAPPLDAFIVDFNVYEMVKPDVHFFTVLDGNAEWSVEFYRLLAPPRIIASINLCEQSVVRMDSNGPLTFFKPDAVR